MAKKVKATCLPGIRKATPKAPVIGVFSPCDPRIDKDSRKRAQNIIAMVADKLSGVAELRYIRLYGKSRIRIRQEAPVGIIRLPG